MKRSDVIATAQTKALHLIASALMLLGTGCLRTTVRSGSMPGDAAPSRNAAWHHDFLLGQLRTRPISPTQDCPQGWAQIDMELNPLQTAIAILTIGIHTPSTVTVVCRADEQLPFATKMSGPAPRRREDAATPVRSSSQ
ncbi:MAG: hypothetical protein QM784_08695 [Polyangiaceae bacterium]